MAGLVPATHVFSPLPNPPPQGGTGQRGGHNFDAARLMLARIRVEPPHCGSQGLMTRFLSPFLCAAFAALALAATPSLAQDRGPGFLDFFNRGEQNGQQQQEEGGSASEVVTRL